MEEKKEAGGAMRPPRVLKGRRHPQEFNWPLRAVYTLSAMVSLPVWPWRDIVGSPEAAIFTLSCDLLPAAAADKQQSTGGSEPSERQTDCALVDSYMLITHFKMNLFFFLISPFFTRVETFWSFASAQFGSNIQCVADNLWCLLLN